MLSAMLWLTVCVHALVGNAAKSQTFHVVLVGDSTNVCTSVSKGKSTIIKRFHNLGGRVQVSYGVTENMEI